jgi:two-component system alkaline phosphatase synthesis response regulator PhoP
MNVQRILVVDDEPAILKVVEYALTREGFEVETAGDGAGAEESFARVSPDLVILDIMLPDKSGLEVARELRAHSNVPVIILSARSDEVDRILGLEFGADDYVTKPFSPRELVSRVKTVLRRAGTTVDEKPAITLGDLQIDGLARQVTVAGEPVHLTRTEYDILMHLARHPGTAFSREAIMAALRDSVSLADERAIDVHIHNIREKLETDPSDPAHILTVRGFGYRLIGQ